MKLRVLDFFKPEETTEASIKLAHRLNPPTGPQEHVALAHWPVESASQDAVLALSAAHEIRDDNKRVLFFREAKRVLRPEGRLVVIEQLRDLPNVLCFGFAALHFLSYSTWLRSFRGAGLTIEKEFKISAFMRAFVLRG
jgi:SAM-dependent methyltransferase